MKPLRFYEKLSKMEIEGKLLSRKEYDPMTYAAESFDSLDLIYKIRNPVILAKLSSNGKEYRIGMEKGQGMDIPQSPANVRVKISRIETVASGFTTRNELTTWNKILDIELA